ncbi:MAG: DUF4350 domain-containing protein [Gemmatimonadota bacterium]
MRPRTEIAIAVSLLIVLGVGAGLLGRRQNHVPPADPRRSSYLTGPDGARGLSDALERLGVEVERFRRRTASLADSDLTAGQDPAVFLVLDPSYEYDGAEGTEVAAFAEREDLVLAGIRAASAMRCFGFNVEGRGSDSMLAIAPDRVASPRTPWVHAVLASTSDSVVTDSAGKEDATQARCMVPAITTADTLLVSSGGRVIAVRLTLGGSAHHVVLVSDGRLFSNEAMRETDAGPFALGLVASGYHRAIFEEYHHGFSSSGSLLGAVFSWSLRSPWGWAVWQMVVVGLLALIAGAIRFGPPRMVINRKRRSPLEHVRALATALAAAHGHDVAVGSIIQGLRRRLSPAGQRTRGDWKQWLGHLEENVRTARARDAVRTLDSLTTPSQPAVSVLRAANAVEDLWEELRP